MSKILITGGAGFVGSKLAHSLISEGHAVSVIDDLSSGRRELVHPEANFINGSVSDSSILEKAFSFRPEYVLHLAALFANQNSVDHPIKDLNVNGLGTLNILEFCHDYKVKKLVYTSSSCVYGDGQLMLENEASFYPDTPYAITKLLGERYCSFWASYHNLDVAIVRLFNTYGPGELPGLYRNVIPNFINLAFKGEALTITGTGEETRDFTYVDDTVDGIKAVLFNDTKPGEVFNIATGYQTSINEIANLINQFTGNNAGVVYKPRRSWDHVGNRRGSVDKIKNELGFMPKTSVETGIQHTCAWIKKKLVNCS